MGAADGLPRMRSSLSEQPKAQTHEYVLKAPVTLAVSPLCALTKKSDWVWDVKRQKWKTKKVHRLGIDRCPGDQAMSATGVVYPSKTTETLAVCLYMLTHKQHNCLF